MLFPYSENDDKIYLKIHTVWFKEAQGKESWKDFRQAFCLAMDHSRLDKENDFFVFSLY